MSLLKLPLLILALAASLVAGACGFSPVHAPGGSGSALYGNVVIAVPDQPSSRGDSNAYFLVRDLEQRLGRTSSGDFALDLTLATRSEGQAITADNSITRYSIIGAAGYSLTRQSDGTVVSSGSETNFTGYSATGSTVETLSGERDAYERLMRILADQITQRLLATVDVSAVEVAAAPAIE
ncbi:LPS assembly lipoprotein LptE [Pseudophaeobacter sp.]|uniref:LPS assembly lipoprotein LptE n=1 Tax=Pseudophaeobacter sp. TaxID=1971739 RepID=UPI0032990468